MICKPFSTSTQLNTLQRNLMLKDFLDCFFPIFCHFEFDACNTFPKKSSDRGNKMLGKLSIAQRINLFGTFNRLTG